MGTDNYESRRESLKQEILALKQKTAGLRGHLEKERRETEDARGKQAELEEEIVKVQQLQKRTLESLEKERKVAREEKLKNQTTIKYLESQIEMLRIACDELQKDVVAVKELEAERKLLQDENESLASTNLQLKSRLSAPNSVKYLLLNEACQKSFAEEVCEMPENLVRKSLEDQKSLTTELHGYIDSVLVSIMEHSPHLLEVL